MENIFRKPDFGKPPEGYRPGWDRGATPLNMLAEKAPTVETKFKSPTIRPKQKTEFDIFSQVDNYLRKKPEKKATRILPMDFKPGQADLKNISSAEWLKIPTSEQRTLPAKRQKRSTPLPDHIIQAAYNDRAVSGSMTPGSESIAGRASVMSTRMDSISSGSQSVTPQGYLSTMSCIATDTCEITDLNKLR